MNLEELILNHKVKEALELVHNDKLPPVFIPSYKNRKGTIIPNLGDIPGEVHLFIYEDDRHNYPESFPGNVTVHEIRKEEFDSMGLEWRGIGPKREYMLEFAKQSNFKHIIMIDDDRSFDVWYADQPRTTSVSNTKKKGSIWDAFKLALKLVNDYDNWGIVGLAHAEINCAHYTWKKVLKFPAHSVAALMLNVETLKDVHYSQKFGKTILEDLSLDVECYKRDIKTFELPFIASFDNDKSLSMFGNNTISSTKEDGYQYRCIMNTYLLYRDYLKFVLTKNSLFTIVPNWKNIEKGIEIVDDPLHNALYEACKNGDYQKVYDILTNGIKKDIDEW